MQEQLVIDWFKRWRKPVRSWLNRRAGIPSGDIDDLAQEVFLRLLRYPTDEVIRNPQGYLFRIAANVASEWRERLRVKQPHDESWLEELPIEEMHQPEGMLEAERRLEYVRSCVDGLPPRQRSVLILHVEGFTYKQIAAAQGITHRMVLREITTAYSTLRSRMMPEDF